MIARLLNWWVVDRHETPHDRAGVSAAFVTTDDLETITKSGGPIDLCTPEISQRFTQWANANPPRYSDGSLIKMGDAVVYRGEPCTVSGISATALHGDVWHIDVTGARYAYGRVCIADLRKTA